MLNVAEATVSELTIPGFFQTVGQTVAGLITGAVGVFTGLWESGVPGQIACTLGIGVMVLGIGAGIFKISKGKKKSK